ncbi:AAA family ATPase [Candidatus Woesearchaeota archaeon]|nr:AAA family ATPase [Candidatus Woesearchaeota archaeon]
MILGLTGPNGAGKGEVAKYLQEKGFTYYSCSDIIREECTKRGLEHSRENLIAVGSEVREKFGPAILAKRIMEKIKNKKGNVIVDSIRNPAEVVELKKLPNFILVMVDAPIKLRFERIKIRGRVENARTLEEFKALEDSEKSDDPAKPQLHKVFAMVDKKIINEGTMEALHQKIEHLLS